MRFALIVAGILTAGSLMISSAANAQPATGSSATAKTRDCSKARNLAHCEAHNKAVAACKDEVDKRACMKKQMPANTPRDCSKARDPVRCEARQKAWEACRDKSPGKERKQCMKEQMKTSPLKTPAGT